jgi:phosphohistidine phosphatase
VTPTPDLFNIYRQSAVIPYRFREGILEILLVTSRSAGRWIIPKGIIETGMTPAESADKEAWEEAGIRGVVHEEPLGAYTYSKWGGECTVEVFPMEVTEEAGTWLEGHIRERCWMSVEEAAGSVREEILAGMIRSIPTVAARRE